MYGPRTAPALATIAVKGFVTVGIVGMALAGGVQSALADGGNSIASAAPVVVGQQEFGNTVNGAGTTVNCDFAGDTFQYSWWALGAVAGDSFTIDWEGASSTTELDVYAVGTTDFTFPQMDPVATQQPNANLKAELKFVANASGSMPLRFVDCGAGAPYDFTVTVKHALRLSLPVGRTLSRRGTINVGVHSPEGGSISDSSLTVAVQISSGGKWTTIGASAVSNARASVTYRVAASLRHRTVRLRALATGGSYLTETSVVQKVTTT
jgi:hypothetical protein